MRATLGRLKVTWLIGRGNSNNRLVAFALSLVPHSRRLGVPLTALRRTFDIYLTWELDNKRVQV